MSLEDDHDHDHDLGDQLLALEDEPQKKGKKKRESGTLRKAPNAPKRFKSSYICFFMAKQPAIKEELGDLGTVTNISKRSAEMWKNISTEERAEWDDVAAKDKQRYMVEKAQYTGPWQVPWKRVKKDPSAPKRPMSAFLYFSQGKRSQIKNENPEIKNTEVSRILGELWRNLSAEERFPYVEQEKIERGKYKIATAAWREEHELKQEADRKMQEMQSELAMSETHPPFFLEPFGTQQVPMMNQYEFPGYQIPYQVPAPGPYQFPINGKQPVILGPNGTPYVNQSGFSANTAQQSMQGAPPMFDDSTSPFAQQNHNYDYSGDQVGEDI